MSNMHVAKRQKYINLFILLRRNEDIKIVDSIISSICQDYGCSYVVKKSFLSNLFYIRIWGREDFLNEIKNRIDLELGKQDYILSWTKSELIEVK